MGALLGGPRVEDLSAAEAKQYVREIDDAWAQWRCVVDRLILDVRIEQEARATLEQRYFGGREVFFADVRQAWVEHVDLVDRLARLAGRLSIPGSTTTKPRGRGEAQATVDRVAERVVRLADDARVRAYEILGDRSRAVAITERRLFAEPQAHNEVYGSSGTDIRSLRSWASNASQTVGSKVCRSGGTTGWGCGTIVAADVDATIGGVLIHHTWWTDVPSAAGDSGSPVLDEDGRAAGIVIATTPTQSVYSTVEWIATELRARPCVTPSCD